MNTDDDEAFIINNTHEEYFNAGSNEERMETERNHQSNLGANRYAAFNYDNDDDWDTHVSQYVESEEKTGKMRENEKVTERHAPKGEEDNRYLSYGTLISNTATKRNTQPSEENTTKGNATDRIKFNSFSQGRFATNRNTIKRSIFWALPQHKTTCQRGLEHGMRLCIQIEYNRR